LVKLQKRFAYKYKDKEYYKNIITLPDVFVEKLGWKEGTELDLHVSQDDDTLVLKSKKKRNNNNSKS
jgi:bifunctional DNA-binding transcriptional regulator/antitoxin component of YhaV-PrlF toxin-antitoxin module